MKISILLGLLLSSGFISCESCSELSSCTKCMGNALERCVWCAQKTMENGLGRCQAASINKKSWCQKEFIQNPDSGIPYLIEDETFSSEVTIRPQALKIKLRPGLAVPFTISYQPREKSSRKVKLQMKNAPSEFSPRLQNLSEYLELKINCYSSFCDEQNSTVHLVAHIKAKTCMFRPEELINVIITPKGLDRGLRIEAEIGCDCNCRNEKFIKEGINQFCDKCTGSTHFMLDNQCKKKFYNNEYCSGKGQCVCGECFCKPGYSGEVCEKDECLETCRRDRGSCTEGKCVCNSPKKTETDCSCPATNKACFEPFSTKVCSGKGYCDCGKCVCQVINKFTDFCENITHYCYKLGDYAACNFDTWTTDNHTLNMLKCDVEHNIDTVKSIIMVDKTRFISKEGSKTAVRDDSMCYHLHNGGKLVFKYKKIDDKESNLLSLMIQNELDDL